MGGPGFVAFAVTMICALAFAFFCSPGTKAARSVQVDTFQKQMETTYGVTLRDEQVDALEYPRKRPEGGTQSFGSIKQIASTGDGKFVRRELTLVWTGKKMVLAESVNGEDFTPLTTQK